MLVSQLQFQKLIKKTKFYKGVIYSFNIYCNNCSKTVFTSSQVLKGKERNKNEMRDMRDWIILCTNCWNIIDSGKKIKLL